MAVDITLSPGNNTRKGRRNRRLLTLQTLTDRAIDKGVCPLEYLLDFMRRPPLKKRQNETDREFDERQHRDQVLRIDVAKACAPYVHAKVSETGPFDEDGNTEMRGPVDVLDLAKKVAFVLTVAARKQTPAPIDITPTTAH